MHRARDSTICPRTQGGPAATKSLLPGQPVPLVIPALVPAQAEKGGNDKEASANDSIGSSQHISA